MLYKSSAAVLYLMILSALATLHGFDDSKSGAVAQRLQRAVNYASKETHKGKQRMEIQTPGSREKSEKRKVRGQLTLASPSANDSNNKTFQTQMKTNLEHINNFDIENCGQTTLLAENHFSCIDTVKEKSKAFRNTLGTYLAESGQFPSHVIIRCTKDGRNEQYCGGVLLNPELVITTARCVTGYNSCKLTFGEMFRESNNESKIQYRFAWGYCTLPGTTGTNSSDGFKNDVALIQLVSPVEFNTEVQPACIDPSLIPKETSVCSTISYRGPHPESFVKGRRRLVENKMNRTCVHFKKDYTDEGRTCYTAAFDGVLFCPEEDTGGGMYCLHKCNGDRVRMVAVGVLSFSAPYDKEETMETCLKTRMFNRWHYYADFNKLMNNHLIEMLSYCYEFHGSKDTG